MKMKFNKKTTLPLIVFLHRNQFTFYLQSWNEAVALPVPVEICRDLECTAKDELKNLMMSFFQQYKIAPTEVVLVLSDGVTFSKSLVNPTEGELKSEEIKKFAQSVPFEAKFSKEIRFNKQSMYFILNRNYYQPILQTFKEAGFTPVALVPQLAIDETLQQPDLSPQLAVVILEQLENLKKNINFLTEEKTYSAVRDISKPSHERELMLVGVFVLMLSLLGGVYFWSRQQSKPIIPPVVSSPATTLTSLQPTIAPKPIVDSIATDSAGIASDSALPINALSKEATNIQIRNGSGTPGEAGDVRSALVALGYTNVVTGNTGAVTSTKSTMIVQTDVPQSYRQEILNALEELDITDVTVQVNDEIEFKVLITITRSE